MKTTMTNDYRTPLSRVRGLGSAKTGTGHFWQQRMTALANLPLVLFFLWTVISLIGASHAEVVVHLSNPFVAIMMVLLIISVAWHMRLGMQIVIEDYIHGFGGLILNILNTFFAIALAASCAFAILKLAFGG